MTTPTPHHRQPTNPGQPPTWYVPSGATEPVRVASVPPPPPVYGQPVDGQPVYGRPTGPQGGGRRPNRNIVVGAVVAGVLAIGGVAYAVGHDDASSTGERETRERETSERETSRTDETDDGGGGAAMTPSDDVLATAYTRITAVRPTASVMDCLRQGGAIAPTELAAVAQGTVTDFETAAAGVLALVDCAPPADAAYGVGESLAYLTGVPWDTGCLQRIWAGLDRGSRITLAAESLVDTQGYASDALTVFASCQA